MQNQSTLDIEDKSIDEKLRQFENEIRKNNNLPKKEVQHWKKSEEEPFYASQRSSTTILMGGLTETHDYFVQGALIGLGYKVQRLDSPDNEALRYGKEFCNKGLCNPTYFTVGNLVKYLTKLRDEEQLSVEEIKKKYVFVTSGSTGPCRFGMYEAEYRKGLEDSGFGGFRVLIFKQTVELNPNAEKPGLELNFQFSKTLVKALLTGDILNALGYQIRPYEINKGETDRVLEECKPILYNALSQKKSLVLAFRKVKKKVSKIKVNFLQSKPVVEIIGEFWAMTTEGDGNYGMQRWLEKEGAEVHVQKIAYWLEYLLWSGEKWYLDRINLKEHDEQGLKNDNPKKTLRLIRLAKFLLRFYYYTYSWFAGLKSSKLPNMYEIADNADQYYNTSLSGGEGHMEVGKLISISKKKKAHMVLSLKPFGCMPSAGVSDGVQSRVQELYSDVLFYPIETTGDNAANIYSRVQMILFKAKKVAKDEFDSLLSEKNITYDQLKKRFAKKKKFQNALHKSPHRKAGTSYNVANELIQNR